MLPVWCSTIRSDAYTLRIDAIRNDSLMLIRKERALNIFRVLLLEGELQR